MKKRNDIRGTILIWTVLLGVAMTSVFFFLAIRLGGLGGIQRESMEYQNQKAYLQSYVAYLMENPGEMDEEFIDEIIKVTLTKSVPAITGILDSGTSVDYSISTTVNIEWNLCSEIENGNIEVDPGGTIATGQCGTKNYDSFMQSSPSETLTLKSPDAPFHYRITKQGGGDLMDNLWHLDAEIRLGFRKKIEMEKVF